MSNLRLDGELVTWADKLGLLEAIWADCEAGNIGVYPEGGSAHYVSLEVNYTNQVLYREIMIPDSAENTLAWIADFYGPDGAAG